MKPGNARTAELLLTNGAGLEAHNVDGATPLIRAAASGNTEVVKVLLDRGATVEARDKYGQTALISAACECASIDMPETIEVLKLLVAKKADVNARDNTGQTALMAAADAGRTDNVRLLLDSGRRSTPRTITATQPCSLPHRLASITPSVWLKQPIPSSCYCREGRTRT